MSYDLIKQKNGSSWFVKFDTYSAQGQEAEALDALLGSLVAAEATALATAAGLEAQIAAGIFEAPTAPLSGVAVASGATGTRATGFYTYGVRAVGPGGESETTLVTGQWIPAVPTSVAGVPGGADGVLAPDTYMYQIKGTGPGGDTVAVESAEVTVGAAEHVTLTITPAAGTVPTLYRIYRAVSVAGVPGTYAEIGRILDSGAATTVFTDTGSDDVGLTLVATADSVMWVTLGDLITLTITPAVGTSPTIFKVYRSAVGSTTPLVEIGRVLCGPTTTTFVDNGTDGTGSTLTSLTIAATLAAAKASQQRLTRGVEIAKIHLAAVLAKDEG